MRRYRLALSLLVLATGCGGHGSTEFGGTAPVSHHFALQNPDTSQPVSCAECHNGSVPPGQDAAPTCITAKCHPSQIVHQDSGPGSRCLDCHTSHMSPNLALVRESVLTPSGTNASINFTAMAGLAPGGLAQIGGGGLCQVCHTDTRFYLSDGSGTGHFPDFACYTCHIHAAGFAPPS